MLKRIEPQLWKGAAMFVILLVLLVGVCAADESVTISFPKETPVPHSYGPPRPYTAEFVFDRPPQPSRTSLVKFHIDPIPGESLSRNQSFELRFDPHVMKVSGPTRWLDSCEGEILVTPLRSGYHGFSIHFGENGYRPFKVAWCLLPTGDLTFLGIDISPGSCDYSECVFFDSTLEIDERPQEDPPPGDFFQYACLFSKVPQIGDTVDITFRLFFRIVEPAPCDLEVYSRGFRHLNFPKGLPGDVYHHAPVDVVLTVVPEPMPAIHELTLHVRSGKDRNLVDKVIVLHSVFDKNCRLLCITDRVATPLMKELVVENYGVMDENQPNTIVQVFAETPERDRLMVFKGDSMVYLESPLVRK